MHFTLLSPIKVAKTKKDGPFQGSFEARVQHIHTFQEHGLEIKKPIEDVPQIKYSCESKEYLLIDTGIIKFEPLEIVRRAKQGKDLLSLIFKK